MAQTIKSKKVRATLVLDILELRAIAIGLGLTVKTCAPVERDTVHSAAKALKGAFDELDNIPLLEEIWQPNFYGEVFGEKSDG